MNIKHLKELANLATPWPWKWFTSNSHNRLSSVASGKDGDVISAFKAADGVPCVSVSREDMGFIEAAHPGAVIDLINGLEAAERERDELRLEIARIGGAKAIEVSRRDAAAGEPVALRWRFIPMYSDVPLMHWTYIDNPKFFPDIRAMEGAEIQEVFSVAPPAVLPPEIKPEPDKYDVIDHGFIAGYNQCRADSLALGAQQQKTFTLQGGSLKSDGDIWYRASAVVELLKSAGVGVKP